MVKHYSEKISSTTKTANGRKTSIFDTKRPPKSNNPTSAHSSSFILTLSKSPESQQVGAAASRNQSSQVDPSCSSAAPVSGQKRNIFKGKGQRSYDGSRSVSSVRFNLS